LPLWQAPSLLEAIQHSPLLIRLGNPISKIITRAGMLTPDGLLALWPPAQWNARLFESIVTFSRRDLELFCPSGN